MRIFKWSKLSNAILKKSVKLTTMVNIAHTVAVNPEQESGPLIIDYNKTIAKGYLWHSCCQAAH